MKILLANKGIAEALNSWLGVVTVIAAGAYGLLEYIEHKQGVRVERSLSYVESYRDGNAANAKLSLNQLLADKQEELATLLNTGYKKESDLNRAYADLILQITSKPSVQRNLEIVFSFFEEVAICVERELCDHEVIQSFFTNEVRGFFNSFYPYVCSLRKQWKNNTVYLKLEKYYVQTENNICL